MRLQHEPETKSYNKARDLQDAIIRARKAGHDDPWAVAEAIRGWFVDAPASVQVATLHYAVAHMWSTTEAKIEPVVKKTSHHSSVSVPERTKIKAEAEAKARVTITQKWLDIVMVSTFAQARALRLIPDEMIAQGRDEQRIGEVFTVAQLTPYAPKGDKS